MKFDIFELFNLKIKKTSAVFTAEVYKLIIIFVF